MKKEIERPSKAGPTTVHNRPPVFGTAQNTAASIPIEGIYEEYQLVENGMHEYVRIYKLTDNNYLTAAEVEQIMMHKGWKNFLNSIGANVKVSVIVKTTPVDQGELLEKVMAKETGDELDYLRKEENAIILNKLMESRNGTRKEKILVISIHCQNARQACKIFRRLETDMNSTLNRINSGAVQILLDDALEMIYGIYHASGNHLIQKTRFVNEEGIWEEVSSLDYQHIRSMGLTVNDLICPSSIQIKRDYIQMGDKFARSMRVTKIANKMMDTFLSNVTDKDFECITNLYFEAIPPKQADAIVAQNLSFIRDQKTKQMRAGQKQNIFDDSYVNPELLDREAEALALRDAIRSKDEQLFNTVMLVTVFADSKEKLDENTESIMTEYKKASFTLSLMNNMQEEGFISTLPLCCNLVKETRTLTSSSLAMFIPFSTLELNDPDGIFYGVNLVSKNLILIDRMKGNNPNSFNIGSSGTGKSQAAKWEEKTLVTRTRNIIRTLDPENERREMAEALGGQVVGISPSAKNYINPMDIRVPEDYDGELDLVNEKVSSILQIMECILKTPFGINSVQEAIVDECVHELFAPFQVNGKLRMIAYDEMPTLTDLRVLLSKRQEPEARDLVYALSIYTGDGSLSIFGHQTNVEMDNRYIVFEFRDVGDRLKKLAMMVILEHLWSEILENRRHGIITNYYIDEIYLFFENEYSANFLNTMVRRGRKYGAVFTGISQNVTTLLENPISRDMLQNCSFVQIFGQSGPDRESLKRILNLSDADMEYITNSPPGQGLIYTGKSVVPFSNIIPKDTHTYKLLTSNPKERHEYAMEKEREEARKQKEAKEITERRQ